MNHEVDHLCRSEIPMEVASCSKPIDEKVVVYPCPRCEGLNFTSLAKLALHYEAVHPGNGRELHTIAPVQRPPSGRKVVKTCPQGAKRKCPPPSIGRAPTSAGKSPDEPVLTYRCIAKSPPCEREVISSSIGVPPGTDRPPGVGEQKIPPKKRRHRYVRQSQTEIQEEESLGKQNGCRGDTEVGDNVKHLHGRICQDEVKGHQHDEIAVTKSSSPSSTALVPHMAPVVFPGVLPSGTQSTQANFVHYQPTVAHVTYNNNVIMTDMTQDDQNELKVHMEAERDLPDELIYWRAVLRCDDGLRARICDTINPSDLIPLAPNIVNSVQENQISTKLEKDGPKKACRLLLEFLMRSVESEWPDQFLRGLEELNQCHLADCLRKKLQTVQEKEANYYRNEVLTHRQIGALGHQTSQSFESMLRLNGNPPCQNAESQWQLLHNTSGSVMPMEPVGVCTSANNSGHVLSSAANAAAAASVVEVNEGEKDSFQVTTERNGKDAGEIQDIVPSAEDVENAGIPPVDYNDLCFNVCDKLSDKQFQRMKYLLQKGPKDKHGIPRDIIKSVKTTQDLLECMEHFNYLDSRNIWFLQYLLYRVGSRPLYKKVFDYITDRLISLKALYVFEPHEIQGAKRASVKLKVTGDINNFRPIDVEAFRQLLAEQCGTDIEYVCVVGGVQGSVILYFQVPAECKKYLLDSTPGLFHWCIEYAILEVFFNDEAIFEVPSVEPGEYSKCVKNADVILDVLKNDVDSVKDKASTVDTMALKIGGKPLLHLATELDNQDMVKYLISKGTKLEETDQMKATALHMAAFLNHLQICEELLKHSGTDVNAVDKLGSTPLHLAAHQGDYCLCALLLHHGASTDIRNEEGETAVDVAKSGSYAYLVNLMINKKVELLTVPVSEYTLVCAICHSSFKKPRILSCGHSFCQNCVETQWHTSNVKETLECAMCKQITIIPDGDVTQLQLNRPLCEQVEEARYIQKLVKPKEAEVSQVTSVIEIHPKDKNEDTSSDVNKKQSQVCSGEKSENCPVVDNKDDLQISANPEENCLSTSVSHKTRVTTYSLTCHACHKKFTKPVRKLACSHSFCELCLKGLVRTLCHQSYITCPSCQEETQVPDGEITKLLRDLILNDQVDDANEYDEHNQSKFVTRIDDEREDWNLEASSSADVSESDQLQAYSVYKSFSSKPTFSASGHSCENEKQISGNEIKGDHSWTNSTHEFTPRKSASAEDVGRQPTSTVVKVLSRPYSPVHESQPVNIFKKETVQEKLAKLEQWRHMLHRPEVREMLKPILTENMVDFFAHMHPEDKQEIQNAFQSKIQSDAAEVFLKKIVRLGYECHRELIEALASSGCISYCEYLEEMYQRCCEEQSMHTSKDEYVFCPPKPRRMKREESRNEAVFCLPKPKQMKPEESRNALNLKCSYWTHDTVFLTWDRPNSLKDAPYQLWYREGHNQATNLPLNRKDNYFTRKSLVLPGANYSQSLQLKCGRDYTFILKAQLEDETFLEDSTCLTMPETPCTDNLIALRNDQDVIKELCVIMDPKPQIYKSVAQEFGVEMKEVRFLESHKTPDDRQITVQILDACIDKSVNMDKLKICNLLRVLHRSDKSGECAQIIFDWHTGRDNGPGPCPVCTRQQF